MYKKTSEKGQILLIVVITMIVALTVGLTIASRTVTELRLSRQNEESQRAFNAAEAGIDRVLQQGGEITLEEALGNNAEFAVSATSYDGSQIYLNNGEEVDQDVGTDVWLSNYSTNPSEMFSNRASGRLTIYWGDTRQASCAEEDNTTKPALEVVLLYGDVANPQIAKYLYDTCSGRTSGTLDGSSTGSYTIPGIPGAVFTNMTSSTIGFENGIIAKVIPLYNSAKVAVVAQTSGGGELALPSQGSVIESTGTSGETVRKITYFQSYPQLPIEVFPYNIISQ